MLARGAVETGEITYNPTSIPIDLTSLRRWTVASRAAGESSHASWTDRRRVNTWVRE
jgi:hypothetical protein